MRMSQLHITAHDQKSEIFVLKNEKFLHLKITYQQSSVANVL